MHLVFLSRSYFPKPGLYVFCTNLPCFVKRRRSRSLRFCTMRKSTVFLVEAQDFMNIYAYFDTIWSINIRMHFARNFTVTKGH